jgi:hypothetical protein
MPIPRLVTTALEFAAVVSPLLVVAAAPGRQRLAVPLSAST